MLREVDADAAEGLALGENFGHQSMHPLDEAEAFGRLASQDGKDAAAIASEFGVNERYVCQRMKLANLAGVVKEAYRNDQIDTATAEAFASVPEDRQQGVWQELNGHPRHAEHVRNIIAHEWIDATHALFDVAALPPSAISRDLFSEKVLVERTAFMAAQHEVLAAERHKLIEDGWKEVVVGPYEDVHRLPLAMDVPEKEFDEATTAMLNKIDARRAKWEAKLEEIPDRNEATARRVQEKMERLEVEAREIMELAPARPSEATKAIGTAFLTVYPDGQVRREYRVPRLRRSGGNGHNGTDGGGAEAGGGPKPPTADDLADKQLAATFTHQALAVREALLNDDKARRRVLALILHDKVRSEAWPCGTRPTALPSTPPRVRRSRPPRLTGSPNSGPKSIRLPVNLTWRMSEAMRNCATYRPRSWMR